MRQQTEDDARQRRGVEQGYIRAFLQGDLETRLALFLNYRELRGEFVAIEERELSARA